MGVACEETTILLDSVLVGELSVLVKAYLSFLMPDYLIDLARVEGMRREWLFAVDMIFAREPEVGGLKADWSS